MANIFKAPKDYQISDGWKNLERQEYGKRWERVNEEHFEHKLRIDEGVLLERHGEAFEVAGNAKK